MIEKNIDRYYLWEGKDKYDTFATHAQYMIEYGYVRKNTDDDVSTRNYVLIARCLDILIDIANTMQYIKNKKTSQIKKFKRGFIR